MLKGKNILLGITGGIAAYKAPELIRKFKKLGACVKVVVTPNALNFVTELSLQTVSENSVFQFQFKTEHYSPEHIELAKWADVFVIAPATASTIGKIANGICDNLLTSIACAFKKPFLIAPAMNTGMWQNTFVQDNIEKLKQNSFVIIPPEQGFLACGTNGIGRLADLEKIVSYTVKALSPQIFKGKKVVITAGGTKEAIDSVRFITNASSGKMGIAIADAAFHLGADVLLISTFDVSKPYSVQCVQSAIEMEQALHNSSGDYIIMAAAVSDFRPLNKVQGKIKKEDINDLNIKLVKNNDILSSLKNNNPKDTVIVGFAAETDNIIENAKKKLLNKNCDFIVLNDVSKKDIGFNSDDNEVFVLNRNMDIEKIEKNSKYNIARRILEIICIK